MTYLNKEKLTEELNKTPMIAQHIDCMDLFDAINNSIAENVTEIVRCKDCKWWHESKTHKGYGDCGQANGITLKSFDWFCADGERRDEP